MQDIPILKGIEGLIFDLDGTIANTMPAHFLAWKEATKDYGIEFSVELFKQLAGIPLYHTVEKLNQLFNKQMHPKEVGDLKEGIFLKTLSQTEPIAPVVRLIRQYHNKLPMSVGTGGQHHIALQTLKAIGMETYFPIIVSSDDIKHPKPHPETFLKCAKQMGIDPAHCQVFEDGILGIEAARRGGMQVTDVTKYYRVTLGEE